MYRINWEVTKQGETIYDGAKSPRGLFYAIRQEIPEVEANGCAYFEKCQVLFEETDHANQDILWISEDFENVFPLQMVKGIADYSKPRLGIISETAANALFHNEDPIGKIMLVNGEMHIEITGVLDLPSNTHLTAQYFVSYKTWIEMGIMNDRADWRGGGWWNYIRLKMCSSPEQTLSKINGFTNAYMGFLANDNRKASFSLQPLSDLHYIKGIEGELGGYHKFFIAGKPYDCCSFYVVYCVDKLCEPVGCPCTDTFAANQHAQTGWCLKHAHLASVAGRKCYFKHVSIGYFVYSLFDFQECNCQCV